MAQAQAPAVWQQMMQAEQSFRKEQSLALERFLAEQRRILEHSLPWRGAHEEKAPQALYRPELHTHSSEPLSKDEEKAPQALDKPEIHIPLNEPLSKDDDSESEDSDDNHIDREETGGERKLIQGDRTLALAKVAKEDDIEPQNAIQENCLPIIDSVWFTMFTSVVVISSVLQLGFDTHFKIKDHFAERNAQRLVMQHWFLVNMVAFIIELVLRLCAEQRDFFRSSRRRMWNLFDVIICLDQITAYFGLFRENVFVCVRIIRLLRVVRVFRVFPELREMLYSFAACAASVSWALLLMFVFFWMYACLLIEVALVCLPSLEEDVSKKKYVDALQEHWDGLFSSIRSLVYTITGGVSWSELAEPFFQMSDLLGIIYCLFVVIVLFGMANILVGIFVRNSENLSSFDRELVLAEALQQRAATEHELEEIFQEMDEGTGEVTEDAFVHAMKKPRLQAYFHSLRINIVDPRAFFRKLDLFEPHGTVDMREFRQGCMRLHGQTKPEDIMEILGRLECLAQHVGSPINKRR